MTNGTGGNPSVIRPNGSTFSFSFRDKPSVRTGNFMVVGDDSEFFIEYETIFVSRMTLVSFILNRFSFFATRQFRLQSHRFLHPATYRTDRPRF